MVLKTTDKPPDIVVPRAERFHRLAILFSHGERQPDLTRVLLSTGQEKVIGREPAQGRFVLYDPSVSHIHARIRFERGEWHLTNESSGGTFVNGRRISRSTVLPENAVVSMGGTLAEFSEDCHVPNAAPLSGLIGGLSFKTRLWFQQLRRACASDAILWLSGPTGSGKSLCAEAIHRESGRKDEPFVRFSCNALSESVIDAELFGHTSGAYTDAKHARPGLFRSAGSGTLFIDEIGELTPELQVKLLLALDTKTVKPVGSDHAVPYQARIIVATNRDLPKEVKAGRFRADLYYRLASQLEIAVPSLLERRADIPSLVASILGVDHWLYGFPLLNALLLKKWEGNVRELVHYVKTRIKPLRRNDDPFVLEELAKLLEKPLPSVTTLSDEGLVQLLEEHNGNITHVAAVAGCTRQAIQQRMKKLRLRATDSAGAPSRPRRR
jgi:DNA-binding NtrC family response regulator